MTVSDLIQEGIDLEKIDNNTRFIEEFEKWCVRVRAFFRENKISEKTQKQLNVKMHFAVNEYSPTDTRQSVAKALKDTICFLTEIASLPGTCISEEMAVMLIGRVLQNFSLYFRTMYKNPVHKRGTLQQEDVESIHIGNEYDLQRMLYSLLLVLFPTARTEVYEDSGYTGLRLDIYVGEYDVAIETKCTRESLTEKKLMEELGADAFFYSERNVFFFIYDKAETIKNPEAFKAAFEREITEKKIQVFVLQDLKF